MLGDAFKDVRLHTANGQMLHFIVKRLGDLKF